MRDKEKKEGNRPTIILRSIMDDVKVQRILYSCDNAGWGGDGFTNRDRQRAKQMKIVLKRKKQVFQLQKEIK